ncbi:5-methyltetrahydrofolate--homocysteine methyltransferase [Papillibacter cinnamivorans DSM 12816]|uniref:5-methyltetrahydrofolate--homocysteine methyltransferase n=1 Tax=Papillibacter cinnamivorans DSM 12816 TaxID=1122930 RepID=A0A1W1YYQ1_9FIRM|nr:5-methyltetrahydrofolate--homocysteine methyltransferase [Papillibacter cinnamivorans DSM 12816]
MDIRDAIRQGTLLFDGAMGTYYAEGKEDPPEYCELANLQDPETILSIHREYIDAGSRAVKTNTFQANQAALGDWETAEKVIRRGYELACRASEERGVFVFADIGPVSGMEEETGAEYLRIADLFLSLGARQFLFETFSSGDFIRETAEHIKGKAPDAFILASFAVSPEGYTRQGISGEQLYSNFTADPNIDAVGFNCMSGPYHLLQFIRKLKRGDKPLSVMPNASYPTVLNNRTFYGNNASYFSTQMAEIVRQGAEIIGGCCGTTPEYIAKTAKRLQNGIRPDRETVTAEPAEIKVEEKILPPNRLLEKLRKGQTVIAVELDPPMDANIGPFMEGARQLKDAGADAITIADCPIARARVDSSMLACKLKRELGIEPLPHMTCRDRNINATKALLLGLSIEGIRNVLVVTGDPIPTASRDEIKSVYNFNSVLLAGYITTLGKEGTFAAPFHISGALNVNAVHFDSQLDRAKRKMDSGIAMFLTQPVLTKQALENLQQAREALPGAKILGGIIPIVSHRNALFMNSEISGIVVSDGIIRLYEDADRERGSQLAVALSTAIAEKIRSHVDGYYLITPFKRVDIIGSIIGDIRSGAKAAVDIDAIW